MCEYTYVHASAKALWPPINNGLVHLCPAKLLQPAWAWSPQILCRLLERDCTRRFNLGHANPKYWDLEEFELPFHHILNVFYGIWDTILIQFEPCDSECCPGEIFHFYLGIQRPCTGATRPTMTLRYSIVFKVCSTTSTGLRDVQQIVPQGTILQPGKRKICKTYKTKKKIFFSRIFFLSRTIL